MISSNWKRKEVKIMYMLVRLGGCIHVFDTQNSRFVKSTFANVRQAMPSRLNRKDKRDSSQETINSRAKILHAVNWVECKDPVCQIAGCRVSSRRRKLAEQDDNGLNVGHWMAE